MPLAFSLYATHRLQRNLHFQTAAGACEGRPGLTSGSYTDSVWFQAPVGRRRRDSGAKTRDERFPAGHGNQKAGGGGGFMLRGISQHGDGLIRNTSCPRGSCSLQKKRIGRGWRGSEGSEGGPPGKGAFKNQTPRPSLPRDSCHFQQGSLQMVTACRASVFPRCGTQV